MSLEQKDTEEYFANKEKKKLEKQKTHDFAKEKQILRESSKLLKRLASEIAHEFGLDSTKVENLIKSETHEDLSSLEKKFTETQKEALAEKILGAQKHIESYSREKREALKISLEEDPFNPEGARYITGKKVFGERAYFRAQHPASLTDHTLGACLGFFDSSEAVVLFVYALGKGIVFTPYHIYLMLKGKYYPDSFRDIF